MTKIYTSADQLIGKTPLLELTHVEKELGLDQNLNINDVIKEKEIGPLDDPELDEPLNINAEIENKQGGGIQI